MTMALITIPPCLLTSLLNEWIDFRDVVHMDSAVCNKSSRDHLMQALRSPGFCFEKLTVGESQFVCNESLILWILKRHIFIKEILFRKISVFRQMASTKFHHDLRLQCIEMNLCERGLQIDMNLMKQFVQNCSYLQKVSFQQVFDSLVDDDLVAICAHIPKLKSLTIANATELTNDGIARLTQVCPKLKSIKLIQCKHIHPSSIYSLIFHLPNLTHVAFESCYGRDIVHCDCDHSMDTYPNLLSLTLKYIWFTDESSLLAILSLFPNLQTLVLRGYPISQNIISFISHRLSQLSNVDFLASTTFYQQGFNQSFVQPWNQLSTLRLSYCKEITDAALISIGQLCLALTRLSLQHCQEITDIGVLSLTKSSLKLQELDLSQCYALSNASLEAIVQCLSWRQSLRKLFLADCKRMSDSAILNLFQYYEYFSTQRSAHSAIKEDMQISHLEVLDMEGCHGLTDVGISLLGHIFCRLRDVSFARCAGITSRGLSSFLHSLDAAALSCFKGKSTTFARSTLQVLNVNRCAKAVSSTFITGIIQHAPHLHTLNVSYCFGTLQTPEAMLALTTLSTASHVSLNHIIATGGTFTICSPVTQSLVDSLKQRGIRFQFD